MTTTQARGGVSRVASAFGVQLDPLDHRNMGPNG